MGCSKNTNPVSTDTGNGGIPANPTEGEFGFNASGSWVDRNNYPLGSTAAASIYGFGQGLPPSMIINLTYFTASISDFHSYYILLGLPSFSATPRTYTIGNSNDPTAASATYSQDSLEYQSTVGSLTITKFDTINNLISGTFTFTATLKSGPSKSIQISTGYFNDIPIYVGSYGQGSITASISGVFFNSSSQQPQKASAFITRGSTQLNIIAADNTTGDSRQLSFTILSLKPGLYVLNGPLGASAASASYSVYSLTGPNISISTESGATGQLIISSVDTIHHRLTGSFHVSGTDTQGDDIQITSGQIYNIQWFDV